MQGFGEVGEQLRRSTVRIGGSGVIWEADGLIVTNAHVARQKRAEVELWDGRLGRRTWVQATVRLAPGNSGGPLADAQGRVIGVNTMIAGGGLALAIPSNTVAEFLLSGDTRAFLGVVVRAVQVRRGIGFLILEVSPQGPAELASLRVGDILTGANGRPFGSLNDLSEVIEDTRGLLTLQFLRGDSRSQREVNVRLATIRAEAA